MPSGTFEVSLGSLTPLTGMISGELGEVGGVAPTTIIRDDEDWYIDLKWSISGPLVPFLTGKWLVNLFLESMGPGPELELPSTTASVEIPFHILPDYNYRFTVPAGTVTTAHFSNPYKVVAVVSYMTPWGQPGPMAGFVELPLINFYHSDI